LGIEWGEFRGTVAYSEVKDGMSLSRKWIYEVGVYFIPVVDANPF
jgi:hypothetical protein